jgi:hypothetical protein
MEVYFFNHHGNGDIHMSRSFINDIIQILDFNYTFFYYSIHKHSVLKDNSKINWINALPNPMIDHNSEFCIIRNQIFINTWYCHDNFKYFHTHCSLYTLHKIFKHVYTNLNLEIKDIYYYIPEIKLCADTFFLPDYHKAKILVCANNVMSFQSKNFYLS